MLPSDAARAEALGKIRKVVSATGEVTGERAERLAQIEKLFAAGEPPKAAPKAKAASPAKPVKAAAPAKAVKAAVPVKRTKKESGKPARSIPKAKGE